MEVLQPWGFLPHFHGLSGYGGKVTPFISYRMKEIKEFFAKNNTEYLALIFEDKNSYVGREVSSASLSLRRVPGEGSQIRPMQTAGPCTPISLALPDPCWGIWEV